MWEIIINIFSVTQAASREVQRPPSAESRLGCSFIGILKKNWFRIWEAFLNTDPCGSGSGTLLSSLLNTCCHFRGRREAVATAKRGLLKSFKEFALLRQRGRFVFKYYSCLNTIATSHITVSKLLPAYLRKVLGIICSTGRCFTWTSSGQVALNIRICRSGFKASRIERICMEEYQLSTNLSCKTSCPQKQGFGKAPVLFNVNFHKFKTAAPTLWRPGAAKRRASPHQWTSTTIT